MNGKKYEEGERFKQNHLNYECENGLVNIIGCYINEQRDLPIGEDVVEKAMVYRCYKRSGVVYYEEYACGSPGNRSCELKPIPASIDDREILPEELKRPGFKSLSIAQ
ncbi:unnamed protein product, partial [Anisakis simplex]|uniref:Abnormal cell migration protein 18-like fibronectin type I domain-containing protein n=1 Tax=Anisakis simplex TaxID=6269 RepID=A0A0M3JC81_ANISI